MISFRYHVVSIAAVFLALVVGIVAGSTVVRGPLVDSLRANVRSAEKNLQQVSDENKRLSGDLGRYQEVDRALASGNLTQLVAGALDAADVVLMAATGVDNSDLRGVREAIERAGGRVVEDVRLDPTLALANVDDVATLAQAIGTPTAGADALRSQIVELFAQGFAPLAAADADESQRAVDGETGTTRPTNASNTTTSIPVARALVELRRSIDMLAGAGFLHVNDRVDAAARPYIRLVVVGAAGATPAGDALAYPLLDRLTRSAPFTVAVETKPATTDASRGAFIRGLRDDDRVRNSVSTVDDGDIWAGRLAMVLALRGLDEGKVGHYGVGEGADAVFPPLS